MTLSLKSLDARADKLQDEIYQLRALLASHEHELVAHEHELVAHEHPQIQRNVLGHLRGAIRGVLAIIEGGTVDTEQRKAIHALRVIIGDAYGTGCAHENCVYEQGERLICQDCREEVSTEAGDGTS